MENMVTKLIVESGFQAFAASSTRERGLGTLNNAYKVQLCWPQCQITAAASTIETDLH